MPQQYRPLVRIIFVVLACLAMAIAGGAPSDHHVSSPSSTSVSTEGQ